MSKTIKYILIGIVLLGVLFLIGYFANENNSPGTIIAGLAGAWAAFKSKIFSTKSLKENIEEVEEEHSLKREEWKIIKDEYDSKFNAIKARMDYLDYTSAKISSQISELDKEEIEEIKKIENITREKRLRLLNKT
ncbi:MAG: hypothetical protein K8R41_08085 [Bacteroidales bacterium]|nr:hypothetical protein [Bacteroidales bacterium]